MIKNEIKHLILFLLLLQNEQGFAKKTLKIVKINLTLKSLSIFILQDITANRLD